MAIFKAGATFTKPSFWVSMFVFGVVTGKGFQILVIDLALLFIASNYQP